VCVCVCVCVCDVDVVVFKEKYICCVIIGCVLKGDFEGKYELTMI